MEEAQNLQSVGRQTPSDLAKSTDPLILDVNPVSSGIQSNKSEKIKQGNRSNTTEPTKHETVVEIERDDAGLEPSQRQRSFSQTYDGVFANLSAKPEVMVLPKDAPAYEDAPPVSIIYGELSINHASSMGS